MLIGRSWHVGLFGPLIFQFPYISLLATSLTRWRIWTCAVMYRNQLFLRSGVLHQGRGCNCKERRTLSRTAGEGVICHLSLQMHGSEWVTQQLFDMAWGIMGPCQWATKAVPWSWQPQSELCKPTLSLVQLSQLCQVKSAEAWFKLQWHAATNNTCARKENVIFEPPLPKWKREAIHSLGMGNGEKQSIRWEWATSPKCSSDQLENSDTC